LTRPWGGLNPFGCIIAAMKRPFVLGAAWTASAAMAVGLGFLAVSFVDAEAAPGTVPPGARGTASSSTPSAPDPSGEQATVGGTVYADCDSDAPDLASAPAPGWTAYASSDPGAVEFRDGTHKLEVHVICVLGGPQFSVEGPRADDRGGSTTSTSAATSPASGETSGGDDSGGGSGGHGSDDSGGDSSGRGGGGHGSDD
jgi:hypothetical protein